MLFHFHLPYFHVHHKRRHARKTRFTDVEAGQRNITAPGPTLVQRMNDDTNDSTPNSQQPDTPEAVKTNRLLPIFSGVMIPFSIMLSIPSLTGHWYIRTENNVTTEIRPNPLLLDVGLGISMACAVLASAFLVIRFAERWVKHMTLASIAFLTLHDLINIPAVTIFGVIHRFDDGFTYGQSFWFTFCSTIVATSTNITLIVDYVTTKDFATSGSGLTSKQRSLVIIVMVLLSYISLGSFIEAKLLDISFLNALYFSVASLESIGFGDIYPTSTSARIFTCFYIVGGIMNIALAVTIARDVILESTVIEFRQRLRAQQHERRLRSRWRAAVRWRLRERGLPTWIHNHHHGPPEEHPHHQRWYDWLSRVFESLFRSVSRKEEDPVWRLQHGPRQKRLNLEALTDADWNAAALETGAPLSHLVPEELRMRRQNFAEQSADIPFSNRVPIEHGQGHTSPHSLTRFRLGGMLGMVGNFAMAVSHGDGTEPGIIQETKDSNDVAAPPPEEPSAAVVERDHEEESNPPRTTPSGVPLTISPTILSAAVVEKDNEEESNLPRTTTHGVPLTISPTILEDDYQTETDLETDAKQMFIARLCIAFSLFFTFWLAGSAIFMKTEKWSFGIAAYFCFVSFTTVGYGDISPKSPAGRSIFVVWALLGVATMTILVSVLMEGFSQRYKNVIKSEVYDAAPYPRPPLSNHPAVTNGADQGLPSSTSDNYARRISRIKFQEKAPDGAMESTPGEFQAMDGLRPPSVLIQVDHLKSLIAMARTQRELNVSCQIENLIPHLEKTLRDFECAEPETK